MSSPPYVVYPLVWTQVLGVSPATFLNPGEFQILWSLEKANNQHLLTPYDEHIERIDFDDTFESVFIPAGDLLPNGYIKINVRQAVSFYAPTITGDDRPAFAAHITYIATLRWRLGLLDGEEYQFGPWFDNILSFNSLADDNPQNYTPPEQFTYTPPTLTQVFKFYKAPCGFSGFLIDEFRNTILFADEQYKVQVNLLGYCEVKNFAVIRRLQTNPQTCEVVLEGGDQAPCDCCCCGGDPSGSPELVQAEGTVYVVGQVDNQNFE